MAFSIQTPTLPTTISDQLLCRNDLRTSLPTGELQRSAENLAQAKASHAHKPAYELPLKVPDALRPRGYIVRKVIDLFGSANGDRTRTLSLERAAC